MLARFAPRRVDLMAFGNSGPVFANSFECMSPVDAAYFILAVRNGLILVSTASYCCPEMPPCGGRTPSCANTSDLPCLAASLRALLILRSRSFASFQLTLALFWGL